MRDTDDSIINLLLEGTKQFEIKVKSYDYWELYAKQYKDLGNRVGDSIAKNTPSEIIYSFFEGLRNINKKNNISTDNEIEFYQAQLDAVEGYPFVHWYKSKCYYSLNEDFEKILLKQSDRSFNKNGLNIFIPSYVIDNLPSYSFFVSTSYNFFNLYSKNDICLGFFVTYEKDLYSDGGYLSIHVVTHIDETNSMRIDPVYLYIPKDSTTSIGECIERAYKAWKKAPTESKKLVSEKMPIIAKRAIQVVLYMCCNNADIIVFRRGSLSGSSKIRHRYGEVSQFEIGNNIGEQLKNQNDENKDIFVRSCHWRGVHHGKRGSDEEKIVLTWIAPAIVSVSKNTRNKYKKIAPEVIETEEKEDAKLLLEIDDQTLDDDIIIDTISEAEPVVDEPFTLIGSHKKYNRNKKIAIAALQKAGFKCEICGEHATFKRKNSGLPYMEPHHLIPMAYQEQFEFKLDKINNIVSLCSNCHNEIHYGMYCNALLEQLYEQRKEKLDDIGLTISLEELIDLYDI